MSLKKTLAKRKTGKTTGKTRKHPGKTTTHASIARKVGRPRKAAAHHHHKGGKRHARPELAKYAKAVSRAPKGSAERKKAMALYIKKWRLATGKTQHARSGNSYTARGSSHGKARKSTAKKRGPGRPRKARNTRASHGKTRHTTFHSKHVNPTLHYYRG